ncbi:7475_t:CDS:1, partial [Scutellospora calospora]
AVSQNLNTDLRSNWPKMRVRHVSDVTLNQPVKKLGCNGSTIISRKSDSLVALLSAIFKVRND